MKALTLFVLLSVFASTSVFSKEFNDVIVTGVIFNAENNFVEFTINKAPNEVLSTKSYKNKQHDYVVAMIISAFESKVNIEYIRAKDKSEDTNVLVLKSMKFGIAEYSDFSTKVD